MGEFLSQSGHPFDAVLIAGPTASGKSAAALALAEALGGIVVNADSMQVYREVRILSARPSGEDMARVPHLLYGHVGAGERYSVGRYQIDAVAARICFTAMQGRTSTIRSAVIAATPPPLWPRLGRKAVCRSSSAAPGFTSRL